MYILVINSRIKPIMSVIFKIQTRSGLQNITEDYFLATPLVLINNPTYQMNTVLFKVQPVMELLIFYIPYVHQVVSNTVTLSKQCITGLYIIILLVKRVRIHFLVPRFVTSSLFDIQFVIMVSHFERDGPWHVLSETDKSFLSSIFFFY